MKKIGYTVILFLLILSLSSCGLIKINSTSEETSTGEQDTTTSDFGETDPPESVETQLPPDIPDPQKWEVREGEADAMLLKVLGLSFENSTLFIVDSTAAFSSPLIQNNVYSEALYARNVKVSQRYGFKITVSAADNATLFDEFKATLASGNTYSDILSVPVCDSGRYVQSGLLKNLRTLAFFETAPEHSIPSFAAASSAGKGVYFSVGYSTLTPSDLTVMYFNKQILDEFSIDLYNEVLCGAFTLERYNQILHETASSSMIAPSVNTELIALEMSGESFFKTGYGTSISISADEASSAVMSSAYCLSSLLYNTRENVTSENDFSIFEEGDTLFRVGFLSDVEQMYDDKVLWGLAPMPKHGEGDGYTTPVNSSVACMMVPSNTTKGEMTSIAISALNASSYKWLLDSASLHYATYYLPDLDSMEVIKLITEAPRLDFAAGAYSLSGKFKATLFDSIRLYATDQSTDLSAILTSKNLSAIVTELKKYYS